MNKNLFQCLVGLQLALLAVTVLVHGHQGHDHDHDHDHQSLSEAESVPETDESWKDSSIHSQNFNGFSLKWKEDSSDSRSVIMKMSARSTGYVAVGFCPVWTGGMDNCDIVLGWVDASGVAHLYDYYALGNTFPSLDPKQDYTLVSGKERDGITSIVFKRLWDTGDDERDANLEHNQNVHVIYAWNDADPVSKGDFEKHLTNTRGHTLKSVAIKGHQHGSGAASNGLSALLTLSLLAVLFWLL